MQEDLRKATHISYKEYQKKVTKKPNEGIAIFVSVFFILLLLFLGMSQLQTCANFVSYNSSDQVPQPFRLPS